MVSDFWVDHSEFLLIYWFLFGLVDLADCSFCWRCVILFGEITGSRSLWKALKFFFVRSFLVWLFCFFNLL